MPKIVIEFEIENESPVFNPIEFRKKINDYLTNLILYHSGWRDRIKNLKVRSLKDRKKKKDNVVN